ncbi:GNAT family N-acetyltransferase [Nocardioides convexus]|uniref:GNAT family N-acetyltransferase n=1 Tax=Nocardioides convexus TaxID=2712224 RepID=UPI0024182AA9|nr:GNAT family N-acetyltransferase [Nocardioides convexus]
MMVAPDLQGSGLGRVLLEHIQAVAPEQVTSYQALHGGGERPQPAALQEGRLPVAAGSPGTAAHGHAHQAALSVHERVTRSWNL